MRTAANRAYIVRLGSWLVLALALLPNISYMGHWPEITGTGSDHHADAAISTLADPGELDAETEAHAAHCHIGPAHCGGGESMVGTPFIGDDTGGLALPGHEAVIDNRQPITPLPGHAPPILQPPKSE
ncbi:MAG: hypothetical protein ABI559_03485 [Chloroflexota bacterium]